MPSHTSWLFLRLANQNRTLSGKCTHITILLVCKLR